MLIHILETYVIVILIASLFEVPFQLVPFYAGERLILLHCGATFGLLVLSGIMLFREKNIAISGLTVFVFALFGAMRLLPTLTM